MTHASGQVWTCDTIAGDYGGHPGLVYEHGPSTFGDLIAGTEQWTDRLFLVHGDRRISFAEFRDAVQSARTALATFGVRAGDRVMVFGYNTPEWVVALWAVWLADAVPVLANRWWKRADFSPLPIHVSWPRIPARSAGRTR
jgi:non-ribosomal peptide synthetase component E (peptide arylation enzyme)